MQDFSISFLQSYAKVPLEIFKVLKVKSVKINIYNLVMTRATFLKFNKNPIIFFSSLRKILNNIQKIFIPSQKVNKRTEPRMDE